jgi:hypothetical protein
LNDYDALFPKKLELLLKGETRRLLLGKVNFIILNQQTIYQDLCDRFLPIWQELGHRPLLCEPVFGITPLMVVIGGNASISALD